MKKIELENVAKQPLSLYKSVELSGKSVEGPIDLIYEAKIRYRGYPLEELKELYRKCLEIEANDPLSPLEEIELQAKIQALTELMNDYKRPPIGERVALALRRILKKRKEE